MIECPEIPIQTVSTTLGTTRNIKTYSPPSSGSAFGLQIDRGYSRRVARPQVTYVLNKKPPVVELRMLTDNLLGSLKDKKSDFYLIAARLLEGGSNEDVVVSAMLYLARLKYRNTTLYYRPAAFGRKDGGAEMVMGDATCRLSTLFRPNGKIEVFFLDKRGPNVIREKREFKDMLGPADFVLAKLNALSKTNS